MSDHDLKFRNCEEGRLGTEEAQWSVPPRRWLLFTLVAIMVIMGQACRRGAKLLLLLLLLQHVLRLCWGNRWFPCRRSLRWAANYDALLC